MEKNLNYAINNKFYVHKFNFGKYIIYFYLSKFVINGKIKWCYSRRLIKKVHL